MRNLLVFFTILTSLMIGVANASVVMTGTRVIFPEQAKEKIIQLRNPDSQLYLMQVQVDDSENVKSDSTGSSSFIATPQIFRMEPNSGQSVRLQYIGGNLPQDRESLFYFSFSQLPILKKSEQVGNQLILAITSRVKIFFRPKGIKGNSADTPKSLLFKMKGKNILVTNPTAFHAVIKRASVNINGKDILLANSVVLVPYANVECHPASSISSLSGGRVRLVTVNDYGVDMVTTISL